MGRGGAVGDWPNYLKIKLQWSNYTYLLYKICNTVPRPLKRSFTSTKPEIVREKFS